MKTTATALFAAFIALASLNASAFAIYLPPGNIVQNGDFESVFSDWSGNIPAGLEGWPSVPGDYCVLAKDIYQDLPTTAGRQYTLSYYAAADLYLAPSVTIDLALNQRTVSTIVTPSYTYDPQVNRYDQMDWQQYTSSFVASGSTTRLEFIDENTYDFGLAGVSVVSVPEPSITALILITGLIAVSALRCQPK